MTHKGLPRLYGNNYHTIGSSSWQDMKIPYEGLSFVFNEDHNVKQPPIK